MIRTDRPTYRPRRTCLSVPGSNPRMIEKAKGLPADQIFLDLEDAVAPDAKASARTSVAAALAGPGWGTQLRGVRVNDWTTPWTHTDVIEVVSAAGAHLDVIVGYRHTGVSFPRGRDEGLVTWELDSLQSVHGLRARLERALLATLDHTGTNPEPDAMLRSVTIEIVRDED